MTTLVVKRWARYGHQRLYVQPDGGASVAYWDLVRKRLVVSDVAFQSAAVSALRDYAIRTGLELALPREATPAALARAALAIPVEGAPVEAAVSESMSPPTAAVVSPRATTPEPAAGTAADVAWSDLAKNRPGQAAREQAVARRQAAPLMTLLARLMGVHTEERAWRLGAEAEAVVGRRLDKLQGWHVLHSVLVGHGTADVDHLAIGPGGVFTINTKNHPNGRVWVGGNTFFVNGTRVPYIHKSRYEAAQAGARLTAATGMYVAPQPLIVVKGATRGFTVKAQPQGVRVLGSRQVKRWLKRRPPVLGPETVERIYEAARRSTTWR